MEERSDGRASAGQDQTCPVLSHTYLFCLIPACRFSLASFFGIPRKPPPPIPFLKNRLNQALEWSESWRTLARPQVHRWPLPPHPAAVVTVCRVAMLHNWCPVIYQLAAGGPPAGLGVMRPADKDKGTDRCKVAVISGNTSRRGNRLMQFVSCRDGAATATLAFVFKPLSDDTGRPEPTRKRDTGLYRLIETVKVSH